MATKKPAKTAATTATKATKAPAKATAAKSCSTKTVCECTAEAPAKKAPAKKAPAARGTRVTFSVRAEIGSKVFVAGSFNNWDATAKQLEDKKGTGLFSGIVVLPKGSYEYKFVINGSWCADPECKDWVQNDVGSYNSVKVVE